MHEDAPDAASRQRFAEGVRAKREDEGITQRELAERMQARGYRYYPQTVTKIESGERTVPVDEALALAQELHTSIDALIRPLGLLREAYALLSTMRRVRKFRDEADKFEHAHATESEALRRQIKRTEEAGHAEALADELSVARLALDYKGKEWLR